MVSELAMAEIEKMQDDGLNPTPRDIIRLNAFGLEVMLARNKHPATAIYYLPRIADIGNGVVIRQPTLAHQIWIDRVTAFCKDDYETWLAIHAYALTRPANELPSAESPKAVQTAVESFCETMGSFTREQIFAAVHYALFGVNERQGEREAAEDAANDASEYPTADDPDGTEGQDWRLCVAVGVMRKAQMVLLGLDAKEIGAMTREQAEAMTRCALAMKDGHGISDESTDALESFYAVRDEIRGRLTNERKEAANG